MCLSIFLLQPIRSPDVLKSADCFLFNDLRGLCQRGGGD